LVAGYETPYPPVVDDSDYGDWGYGSYGYGYPGYGYGGYGYRGYGGSYHRYGTRGFSPGTTYRGGTGYPVRH
jgi:hypothetical protein